MSLVKRWWRHMRVSAKGHGCEITGAVGGFLAIYLLGGHYGLTGWYSLTEGRLPDQALDGIYYWFGRNADGTGWYSWTNPAYFSVDMASVALALGFGMLVFWLRRRGLLKKWWNEDRRAGHWHLSLLAARVLHGNLYVEESGRDMIAGCGETVRSVWMLLGPSALEWRWAYVVDYWGHTHNVEKAWRAALAGDGVRAVRASIKALNTRPGSLIARTNLAHGLLLLGEKDAARKIYAEHKGQVATSGCRCEKCLATSKMWDDTILEDAFNMMSVGVDRELVAEIVGHFLEEE